MALLDLTPDELLTLRNAIDGYVASLAAHQKATEDVFVAAAIGVTVSDVIYLRQKVVRASKPAPWPILKQSYDDMQSGDGLALALVCRKHGEPGCGHCQAVTA